MTYFNNENAVIPIAINNAESILPIILDDFDIIIN